MWNRFELWYKFEGRYVFKKFKYGIRNLFIWFPTVWRDRDWDNNYIYEVLKFKLEKQSKSFDKYGRHLSSSRDAEKMKTVSKLISKLTSDFYASEYIDYYEATHEFVKVENSSFYTVESTVSNEDFKSYFDKYPRQYKRALSGDLNYFGKDIEGKTEKIFAMEIAMDNHNRARKLVFKMLENNIEGWWF
jgi:hypothetical protein